MFRIRQCFLDEKCSNWFVFLNYLKIEINIGIKNCDRNAFVGSVPPPSPIYQICFRRNRSVLLFSFLPDQGKDGGGCRLVSSYNNLFISNDKIACLIVR